MLYQIPKPNISPDFTLEDIRKIRTWHYEILKDATDEERRAFYKKGSQAYDRRIAELGLKRTM
ncbi:hypothetical protein FACS1894187_16670 [Synergistales bacterium]|nr:hypothetical protein FACS1894187_16670 [Synergistales bacterium]GHV45901.1 hypothetical protein FACS1894204_06370 [Synergistales bacterium]